MQHHLIPFIPLSQRFKIRRAFPQISNVLSAVGRYWIAAKDFVITEYSQKSQSLLSFLAAVEAVEMVMAAAVVEEVVAVVVVEDRLDVEVGGLNRHVAPDEGMSPLHFKVDKDQM